MKMCLRSSFSTLVIILLFNLPNIFAQNIYISGPEVICEGECATYYHSGDSLQVDLIWGSDSDGITIFDSTGIETLICFDSPGASGSYNIYLYSNDEIWAEFLVEVVPIIDITITPDRTCPGNPGGCTEVCAYSTVTYSVSNFGGNWIEWDVQGAESYEVDGFEVTVTWGAPTQGSISASADNSWGCSAGGFLCVDVLEEPIAAFNTMPGSPNANLTICEGQTVFFDNVSEYASSYEWNFGDGAVSTDFVTSHQYLTPGVYTASLVAFNSCLCSDTTSITIEVVNAESPFIDCVGTICENETVTYSSSASCGDYFWTVSNNGTVIDGGGTNDNFVTIEWGNGPAGTIELSVANCPGGATCMEPAVVRIPILSELAEIEGPERVCFSELSTYQIEHYDGTFYNWTVTGGGLIRSGQGTNHITVEWITSALPSAELVSVTYENCYLECGGEDELAVTILPQFFVEGPSEGCENGVTSFTSKVGTFGFPGIDCNWRVSAPDGSVLVNSTAADDEFDVNWTAGPGIYTVTVIPDDLNSVCGNLYSVDVTVEPASVAADAIDGELSICPGQAYTYTAQSSLANPSFIWEITNGTNTEIIEADAVNVEWGAAPPHIVAVAQYSNDGLPCPSDYITILPSPINGFAIAGNNDACIEDPTVYNTDNYDNVNYEWRIEPADAGSIKSGQSTSEIEVYWHTSGTSKLILDLCGQTEEYDVFVNPRPEPVVQHPLDLCEGVTASISTSVAFTDYKWFNEDSIVIASTATPDLLPGYYHVEVTDAKGCVGDASFYIRPIPQPEIRISTPDFTGFCPGDPAVTLYALDTEDGYSYEWFRDGTSIGNDNPLLTTDVFGFYQVEVTNQYGCKTLSNRIRLFDYCGDPCPDSVCNNPPCIALGDISFLANAATECNLISFTNTSVNAVPGSSYWTFENPESGADNYSTLDNPTHRFTHAGFYKVLLRGLLPTVADPSVSCLDYQYEIVTVPMAAHFTQRLGCPGEVSEFEDLSTFIPGEDIVSWNWNFGDPGSGADNTSTLQIPSHTFNANGTYTVSLTIQAASGCISTYTQDIEVHPNPVFDFNEPVIACESTALEFAPSDGSTVIFWDWDFGDGSSGDANTAETKVAYHTYDAPGNYTVTLTGENVYGCTNTFTRTITIEPNGMNGDITLSASSPICEGETTTLSPPSGGVSWEWSDGSTNGTLTVGEAGFYEVTVTNADGCTYIPDGVTIDVNPAPEVPIKAVEYNDFNQPVSNHYGTYEACEGDEVFIEAGLVGNYTYMWSNSVMGNLLEFTEIRGNLLPEGTHNFSLDLTNTVTGCTNTVGPYEVIIHPLPDNVTIVSSGGSTLCEGNPTTLDVVSPNASFTYLWSNGENGTSITTESEGEFTVTAINAFGCEAESNTITILPAPDISKIPTGCLTRCRPDTICIPNIPGVVSYQWFYEGTAIPGGTDPNLVATESGVYHVEMVSNAGCLSTSDPLTLDLYDGFGTIEGNIYVDVNEDGMIDSGDTLTGNVDVILYQGGVAIDTVTATNAGMYTFANIPSEDYILVLDGASLPSGYAIVIGSGPVEVSGCDDVFNFDYLVTKDCPDGVGNETLYVCSGDQIDYNGYSLPSDTVALITLQSVAGCDSIVTVTVLGVQPDSTMLVLEACSGGTVEFNGDLLAPGTQKYYPLVNSFGCDSIVQVTVEEYAAFDYSLETEESCWNTANGIVSVSNFVGQGPFSTSADGAVFDMEDQLEDLPVGIQEIYIMDGNGCIQTEEIEIEMIEPIAIEVSDQQLDCETGQIQLDVQVLQGDASGITFTWNNGTTGAALMANEPGVYTLTATNGCESVETDVNVTSVLDSMSSYLYIPNIFTPNADGVNDMFKPEARQDIELMEFELSVYDRWGTVLHQTDDITTGWEGFTRGKKSTPGVYIWQIKCTVSTCNEVKELYEKGDVTLLR